MKKLIIAMLLMAAPCAAYDYANVYQVGGFSFQGKKGKNRCYLLAEKLDGEKVKCKFRWAEMPRELSSEFLNGARAVKNLILKDTNRYSGVLDKYEIDDIGESPYGCICIDIRRDLWESADGFELAVTLEEADNGTGD